MSRTGRFTSVLPPLLVALAAAPLLEADVGVGQRPRLEMRTTLNQRIDSEILEGRIVILDFWATWCGPCVAAMPHMKRVHGVYHDKGVQIIGISLDHSRRDLERYVKREKIDWPQVHDQDNRITDRFGVRGIPHIVMLSPEGAVLWTGGPHGLERAVHDALRDHPPTVKSSARRNEDRAAAIQALSEARAAIDAGDFALMLEKIGALPEDALGDRHVRTQATVFARKFKARAGDSPELAQARAEHPEADGRLTALLGTLGTASTATRADDDLGAGPDEPPPGIDPRVLDQKLARIDRSREAAKHDRAYELCQWIVRFAPDSEQAIVASDHISAYEADEPFMERLRARRIERDARRMLAMARNYDKAGRPDLARETLEALLEQYDAAEECCAEARRVLDSLQDGIRGEG